MRWSFRFATIGLLAVFATAPAQARNEVEQIAIWRSQLQQAYCVQDWTEAASLSAALMGSDISQSERLWLFYLRQDIYNFQYGVAAFPGCEDGIVAGITAEAALAAASESAIDWESGTTRVSRSQRSRWRTADAADLDWTRGTAFAGRNSTTPERTALSATTDNFTPTGFTEDSQAVNTALTTTCGSPYPEERRVADGSTSNQWNYETWEDSNQSFYIRYWRQYQTCDQAYTTSHYSTQNDAWQEFMEQIDFLDAR